MCQLFIGNEKKKLIKCDIVFFFSLKKWVEYIILYHFLIFGEFSLELHNNGITKLRTVSIDKVK